MLRILRGKLAGNFREAVVLAFREAGMDDALPNVADLFSSTIDNNKLMREADNSISSSIHRRYGRSATWEGRRWLIPVPQLQYKASPIPHLTINVQAYIVEAVKVETTDYFYSATLIGPIGRAETLVLPMSWLLAILENDLGRFEITSKDATHIGWNVPGLKEAVILPNDFTTKLSTALRLKSVRGWLEEFGHQGNTVAPLVTGALIGLQLHGVIEPLPVGQQAWRREIVVDTLTRMFGSAKAAEMFAAEAPYLRVSMSNEEVISFILKEAGRRV